MKVTRKNNPIVKELEEQIMILTTQLVEMVKPTNEEIECSIDQINDQLNERGYSKWAMSCNLLAAFIAQDTLDGREIEEEEENAKTND